MIERDQRDGVMILRLSRGKVNALDLELVEAISGAAEDATGPSTAAVVLTGTGPAFSAGVDLFRLLDEGERYFERFYPALVEAIRALWELDKPLVAAINGHAIAGGCIVAQCADFRLMARDSGKIGVPELLVGVPFPTLALEIMRERLAPAWTRRIVLGGVTIDPDTAVRAGLVDEVCEPDQLLDRALAEAKRLAAISPPAYALTRRELRRGVDERVAARDATEEEVKSFWKSEETKVRIRDYLDRTVRRA